MTGDAAVQGIRQADPNGSIGMVGAEPHPPYDRPPLSKGLWRGNRLESIWQKNAEQEAILHLGRTATMLDLAGKRLVDKRHVYTFREAPVGHRRLHPAACRSRIEQSCYFRTLDDTCDCGPLPSTASGSWSSAGGSSARKSPPR